MTDSARICIMSAQGGVYFRLLAINHRGHLRDPLKRPQTEMIFCISLYALWL